MNLRVKFGIIIVLGLRGWHWLKMRSFALSRHHGPGEDCEFDKRWTIQRAVWTAVSGAIKVLIAFEDSPLLIFDDDARCEALSTPRGASPLYNPAYGV
jgi:hypothetical protein